MLQIITMYVERFIYVLERRLKKLYFSCKYISPFRCSVTHALKNTTQPPSLINVKVDEPFFIYSENLHFELLDEASTIYLFLTT